MISLKTLLIASLVVTAGWLTGKAIHGFVDFVIEFLKDHERDNRDE
jgi:hypothetical protein